MIRWAGAAVILGATLLCAAATEPAYRWTLPKGIAPPPVPADNLMSEAKVALGRRLFYDGDLSIDGTLSCATCHEQRHGFAEGEATHGGVKGAAGRRNVMTLANIGYLAPLTWADSSQKTLESQVMTPLMGEHPVEMGMAGQQDEVIRRLTADRCYSQMFADAFPGAGGQITLARTTKALAAFERTLVSWNAPYDRAQRGERDAMSDAARRGQAVFQAKGCASCHSGPNFTDLRFHTIAPARNGDHGLVEKTGDRRDEAAFRTPSLRNADYSAPYLHNGQARTLAAAILAHDNVVMKLKPEDVFAIEPFLESLTDQTFLNDPNLALPRSICGQSR
jgi:cytochrome c peroxidase